MCLLRLSELNCVSTKMCRRFEFKQLLMGMSMRRYLPPIGTAGFERLRVSGNRRVPRPPPRMIARTSSMALPLSHGTPGPAKAGTKLQENPDKNPRRGGTHFAARACGHAAAKTPGRLGRYAPARRPADGFLMG